MPAAHAADTRRDLARRPALSRAGRESQEFQVHRMVSFITPGCCFFLEGRSKWIGWRESLATKKKVESAEAMLTKRHNEAEKVHWAILFPQMTRDFENDNTDCIIL